MNRYAILLMVLFAACNGPVSSKYGSTQLYAAINEQTDYKVIGIKDGDTFVLLMNGKEQVVRLAHIDCPEKKQPFGNKAKQYASDACFGKQVTLVHNKKYDRNKRLIAEIILHDGRNLNKELVKNGLAWHFKRYSYIESYAKLEATARKNRIGLWADKNPIAPWSWRRK
ncbi:MAG: thermonuclease family protein [Niabella sp.]